MTKYTIYKAFEKKFPSPIWKIVVDGQTKQVGIETRDHETTRPTLYVLDFEGETLLNNKLIHEKEWTLEALQHGHVILKRLGDTAPINAGIQLLDLQGNTRYLSYDYMWVDTCIDFVKMRPRSIQNGFEEYLDIKSATKAIDHDSARDRYNMDLKMPAPFTQTLPPHLAHLDYVDRPWISRVGDKLLISYHRKDGDSYQLNLCISCQSKVLHEQTLLQHMPKMIPQPYFQLGHQIFLMSYNKQEIVSYLV
ncbi:hypothetical protein [Sphingobacterium griseoflavum]|uniref:DUF4905 domain-containing protein n=1 Tax=Sphingobacterium griseoflavum TaxID=1474952 RepID=A0ABQ3HST1_9SPHI|nr:hypothetical protein [Sphingobacterium griseoflavum]GHE23227.1 hypothetical protein GCM10017764_01950 [Sphingobacterium griseoflavum]